MATRPQSAKYNEYADKTKEKYDTKNKNMRSSDKKHNHSSEQTLVSSDNRLPVNLFYTAAEYNKMLITNGKSTKKKSQPIIQGFIQNLEFINDPIFQSCEQRKQSLRLKQKKNVPTSERKPVNSFTQSCNCCCCEQFCQVCAKEQNSSGKKTRLNEYQLQSAIQKINTQPLKAKRQIKKKIITSEVKIVPFKKQQGSEKQPSSSYLSQKSFNIQKLVCQSLIQYQSEKRKKKLKQLQEKQKKQEAKSLVKDFCNKIRQRNKHSISRSKSVGESATHLKNNKNKIRLDYWQSIKEQIKKSIQKDKSEGKKHKSAQKSRPKSTQKGRLSPEKQELAAKALKYQKEAKMKIQKEKSEKAIKKQSLKKNLKAIQDKQELLIKKFKQVQFKPTPEMMEKAFTDLVEQTSLPKSQKQKLTVQNSLPKPQTTLKKKNKT